VDAGYSEELQSVLSRFGTGPAPKGEVMQYLARRSSQSAEWYAGGVFDGLLSLRNSQSTGPKLLRPGLFSFIELDATLG
jgi:hypothetical protein